MQRRELINGSAGTADRGDQCVYTRAGILLCATAAIALLIPWAYNWAYYRDYRLVGDRLASLPGVRVIGSWKHEDVILEDFGYTIRVRRCPTVRLDFYDGHPGAELFEGIDELIVWSGDGSRPGKVVPGAALRAGGAESRNLPELLARLEAVLAVVDAAPDSGEPWP